MDSFDKIFNLEDQVTKKKNEQKAIDMTNHKSHSTIFNLPSEIKDKARWMYTDHLNKPTNQFGELRSYKREQLQTLTEVHKNNPNKLYYNYVLNGDFLVIDLDDCIDSNGVMRNFGKEVLSIVQSMNPYIEYSKSGRGLHIIFDSKDNWTDLKAFCIKLKKKHEKYSDLPTKCGIEFFNQNKCITLTGDTYENCHPGKIGKVTKELKKFYESLKQLDAQDKSRAQLNYKKKLINKSVDDDCIFQLINSKVSIEDVAEKLEIESDLYRNIHCPLPDHEDATASFRIYNYSNSWYCFGCKKTGDVTGLVAQIKGIRNIDAAKIIDEMFDLEINFEIRDNNMEQEWVQVTTAKNGNEKIEVDLISLRNHLFEQHHIYVTEHKILMFKDNTYKEVEELAIKKLIESHMPSVYNNKFKHSMYVNEVFKDLERNFKSFRDFNKDTYKINLLNGYLDMKGDMELHEHSPEYLDTYQIQGNFNPNAVCKKWHDFLDFALSKEQQELLQEYMGYCLMNNNKAKKMLVLYGVGDSGKSVILDVLVRMIGHMNTSAMPLQELGDSKNKFAASELLNKLINVCSDLSKEGIESTALIKQLTSSTDMVKYEKKGSQPYFDYNTARLCFSTNHLPPVRDKSKEFFNRVIMIKFNNSCPKDKIETDLIELFNFEGIINWCIQGAKRLVDNRLQFSIKKENDDLVESYQLKDSPVLDFFKIYITITDNKEDQISNTEFLNYYKYFCKFIANNEFAAKMKLSNIQEELENNFRLKKSKHVLNPTTNKKNARGYLYIKIDSDFKAEFENQNNMFS